MNRDLHEYWIPKEELEKGETYIGNCRNASYARWNGEMFLHWRNKFGQTFLEGICCPEDDKIYDVFYAKTKYKEIPLE